ncbi:MAG TPA: ribosome maturation factor RimM [Mycobacteriales bacterium]|nr:ribosome maturation factor RimM [Mycobacteriales bacterium]
MQLVVGRIGKAHGVKGEVSVDVRTDDPERRFVVGERLSTDPDRGDLEIVGVRAHHGRLLIAFRGVSDRNAAESLRGTLVVVDSSTVGETGPDEWWDHDLVGLRVELGDGAPLGEVTEVVHLPGNDLLAIKRDDGREALIPFVAEIVPIVDVRGGRVVVEPPEGLLDLDAPTAAE